MTEAGYVLCVAGMTTLIVVAPRMTWLFVRISPPAVMTIPVPAAEAFWYARFVVTSTTPFVGEPAAGVAAWALPAKAAPSTRTRIAERILATHHWYRRFLKST